MLDGGGYLDFGDMVLWLHDEFTKDGYDISDTIEEKEYLSLPIDLFCTKGEGKAQGYCVVIVASITNISDEFQKKLLFYQYYLSLHYKPSQYKIVLAIPASATVVTIPYNAETEEEKKQDFYKEHGFGLWKIRNKDDIDKETYGAITLTDKIAKDFGNIIAKDDKRLIKITTKIPAFVDRYIHDSVYGIAGFNPVKFEERYIDAKLLHKTLKLKKISYRNHLFNAISEHLSYKDNEYDFVRRVFSELWKEWIGVSYNDFLETFDPALQHVFAEKKEEDKEEAKEEDKIVYRDHYIHQFQVFLSGLYIIDKLYDNFTKQYNKPEISWLIISSFHDMAWPVQLYDKWSGEFFKKLFNVEELGHVELKSKFVEESFMNCTNCLIARLCRVFGKEELKDDWLADKNNLVQFFFKKITEAKKHCILSSISLLKMVEDPKYTSKITIDGMSSEDILEDIFIPSALAIALHDKDVWRQLKDKEKWQKLKEKCPLPVLKFEVDPLSFLLVFCDNIQEWGRPSQSQTNDEGKRRKRFYLKELKYDPQKGFEITIWTPKHTKAEPFFTDKQEELREIQSFLQHSDRKFAVRLEDKDGKGEDFIMQGSPF